jgi:hypothetical protein
MVSVPLELELSLKGKRRYQKTLGTYRTNKAMGFLWYVVSTEGVGRSILKHWLDLEWNDQKEKFFWTTLDEIMEGDPREIALHHLEKAIPLSALVQMTPAHIPAQGVSNQTIGTRITPDQQAVETKGKSGLSHQHPASVL